MPPGELGERRARSGLSERWHASVERRVGTGWARTGTRTASDLPPVEEQLTQLASDLAGADDVGQAFQAVTLAALLVVDGAEFAGITLGRSDKQLESAAPTSPRVIAADLLQYDLEEGPCVEVARGTFMVLANNVAHDPRWPSWGTAISQTVASVLSVQLASARGIRGVINIYSSRAHAYSHRSQLAAAALSVHASALLHSVSLEQDRKNGAANQVVVGQAQGILMHRFGIGAEAALAVLDRLADHRYVPAAEFAARLVTDPDMHLDRLSDR